MLDTMQETVNDLGFAGLVIPAYPLGFIETLHDTGYKALSDWLIANNAPLEVIQVSEGLLSLFLYALEVAENEEVARGTNVLIEEMIGPFTRGIDALGGSFYGPTIKAG